jgi:hypothetical protein
LAAERIMANARETSICEGSDMGEHKMELSLVSEDHLIRLTYELADAHDDTRRLAEGFDDEVWRAHVDYLRGLQRVARETLACWVAEVRLGVAK